MNRKIYYFQCISKLSHCKSTVFFDTVKKKVSFQKLISFVRLDSQISGIGLGI